MSDELIDKINEEDVYITKESTVKDSLKKLDNSAKKALLVTDDSKTLLGAITDGDIRRHLLMGKGLDDPIEGVYNPDPIFVYEKDYSEAKIKKIFLDTQVELIPIINNHKKILYFVTWNRFFSEEVKVGINKQDLMDLPVIIMAGGKGTRMAPFTKVLPKPLIPVGEKTILEHIIDEFSNYGNSRYYFTLNYKGELIEAYFKSLKKDYNLDFIWEKDFFGTAGALTLMKEYVEDDFIVSNCDVIVKADYSNVFNFHKNAGSYLTIISSYQHHKIPYGVVSFDKGGFVKEIVEKPEYSFPINTGVYILNKGVFDYIPKDTFYNMTDLIKDLIDDGKKVLTYPVNENAYIDIGQWEEYKKTVEKLQII